MGLAPAQSATQFLTCPGALWAGLCSNLGWIFDLHFRWGNHIFWIGWDSLGLWRLSQCPGHWKKLKQKFQIGRNPFAGAWLLKGRSGRVVSVCLLLSALPALLLEAVGLGVCSLVLGVAGSGVCVCVCTHMHCTRTVLSCLAPPPTPLILDFFQIIMVTLNLRLLSFHAVLMSVCVCTVPGTLET